MKTKLLTLAPLLLTLAPLVAQQPASDPPAATAEPRAGRDQNRRGPQPGQPGNPGNPPGRENRGDANQPRPGGWGPGAQNPSPPQPPHGDPFSENFFPPEVIMHHQQALNLPDDQRKRLIDIVQKAQPQFTELQWQLEAEQGALMSLMRTERPDEKQIGAQLDKVLRLEGEMKRGQLMMLVRLKNELSAEQQARLRDAMRRPGLDPANRGPGMPAPRPPGGGQR